MKNQKQNSVAASQNMKQCRTGDQEKAGWEELQKYQKEKLPIFTKSKAFQWSVEKIGPCLEKSTLRGTV